MKQISVEAVLWVNRKQCKTYNSEHKYIYTRCLGVFDTNFIFALDSGFAVAPIPMIFGEINSSQFKLS